jgi:hypothetical protein
MEKIPTIILAHGREWTREELDALARDFDLKRRRLTQEERVALQKYRDAIDIADWNEKLQAAGGDVRKAGREIPRIPYEDLEDSAAGWHSSGWGGRDTRPRIVVTLPDGRPFRAKTRSAYDTDWIVLADRHLDPSGRTYAQFNLAQKWVKPDGSICKTGRDYQTPGIEQRLVAVPCLNEFDAGERMTHEELAEVLYDLDLETVGLTNNPTTWPPDLYAAFLAGHPGFTWTGFTRIEPWVVQG